MYVLILKHQIKTNMFMIHLFKETENVSITVFLSELKMLCILKYNNKIKRSSKKITDYNKILKLHLENGFKIIE